MLSHIAITSSTKLTKNIEDIFKSLPPLPLPHSLSLRDHYDSENDSFWAEQEFYTST